MFEVPPAITENRSFQTRCSEKAERNPNPWENYDRHLHKVISFSNKITRDDMARKSIGWLTGWMGDARKIFAENLRFFRERRGLTQESLAESIGNGCSAVSISRLETGRVWVTHKRLKQLAKALNEPEESFFSIERGSTRFVVKQAVDALIEVYDLRQ